MVKAAKDAAPRVAMSVTITSRLREQIDRAARGQGVSRSEFVRQAVEEALEDLDDVEVARARLADPNEEDIPWEVVKAEAGL